MTVVLCGRDGAVIGADVRGAAPGTRETALTKSENTVERANVLSKCGWSPFEGTRFSSRIAATFVNGELVWDGQRVIGEANGQRLEFAR